MVVKKRILMVTKMMDSMNVLLLLTMTSLDAYLTICCQNGFAIYHSIRVLQYSIAATGNLVFVFDFVFSHHFLVALVST
jgi:hypothetical protein